MVARTLFRECLPKSARAPFERQESWNLLMIKPTPVASMTGSTLAAQRCASLTPVVSRETTGSSLLAAEALTVAHAFQLSTDRKAALTAVSGTPRPSYSESYPHSFPQAYPPAAPVECSLGPRYHPSFEVLSLPAIMLGDLKTHPKTWLQISTIRDGSHDELRNCPAPMTGAAMPGSYGPSPIRSTNYRTVTSSAA